MIKAARNAQLQGWFLRFLPAANLAGRAAGTGNVAETSLPSALARSTSKPPRARKPLSLLVGHALGNAGSSSRSELHSCRVVLPNAGEVWDRINSTPSSPRADVTP